MNTVFTTIMNNYDTLKEPEVSPGWQYVVFSDKFIKSDVWECIITEKGNRDIKIRPHLEMFDNLTLYVDGSIEIIGDLNEFVSEVPNWFSIWKHPDRNCIYDEARTIIEYKLANAGRVTQQMIHYQKAGFPYGWGLGANGIMLRDLSDDKVTQICDLWWNEFQLGSRRDQLSLMYCFYRLGYKPDFFGNEVMGKYFKWGPHNEKVAERIKKIVDLSAESE